MKISLNIDFMIDSRLYPISLSTHL